MMTFMKFIYSLNEPLGYVLLFFGFVVLVYSMFIHFNFFGFVYGIAMVAYGNTMINGVEIRKLKERKGWYP